MYTTSRKDNISVSSDGETLTCTHCWTAQTFASFDRHTINKFKLDHAHIPEISKSEPIAKPWPSYPE